MYEEFNRLTDSFKAIIPFVSNKEKNIWNVLSTLSVLIPFFALESIYIIFPSINTLLGILLSLCRLTVMLIVILSIKLPVK